MLLKHRAPEINTAPVQLRQGLEHLEQSSIELLRWLNADQTGLRRRRAGRPCDSRRHQRPRAGGDRARPLRAQLRAPGDALVAQHAGLRSDRGLPGSTGAATVPVKLTGDKLARGRRWMLRFGGYDLDVEGAGKRAAGAHGRPPTVRSTLPAIRSFSTRPVGSSLAEGVSAWRSPRPEDLEHFSHVRRTGSAPEFRVIPQSRPESDVRARNSPTRHAERFLCIDLDFA